MKLEDMTLEEKRELLGDFCDSRECDKNCPFNHEENSWCMNHNNWNIPEDVANEAITKYNLLNFNETNEVKTEDVVNHPSHYTNGGMECIDEMILVFGEEAVMHFCICNAWKYRKRAMYKNGQQDMDKSDWYLAKFKELKNNVQYLG